MTPRDPASLIIHAAACAVGLAPATYPSAASPDASPAVSPVVSPVVSPTPAPSPPAPPPVADWAEHAAQWATQRPWLAAVAATALIAWVAARNLLASWRHNHHARDARLVTIAPPPEVDPAGAAAVWANLAGILTPSYRQRLRYGHPHVALQYTWAGRELRISLWVPGTVPPGAVEAAIRGAWPGAATTTEPAAPPIPSEPAAEAGGHLLPVAAEWLPLRTEFDTDPLRALIAAGSQLRDNEHACVQVLARPARTRRVARARRAAARLRDGKTATPVVNPAAPLLWLINLIVEVFLPAGRTRTTGSSANRAAPSARRDPGIDRDVRAIVDKTAHPLWETAVRYGVASTLERRGANTEGRLRGIADAIASAFAVYTARNRLTHRARMRHPVAVLAARRLGAGFLTSTPELAALAALPQDLAVPGLDRAHAKSMPVPVAVSAGGRGTKILGDAEIGGHAVALSAADARYHVHMIGSTGSGKTTLLANMVLDDVHAGRGTVVIDPHGDLVLDILDRLPASVADRVVLFDPDQPNPPTINPLEGTDHDLVVDNIVSIFGNIFVKAWGPRMDDVMRVACLTLLRHPNVTLQHIPPLLNSPQFRSEMVIDLDDPEGLRGFWQWYDEMPVSLRSQVIAPVLARLRSFLLRDFVKKTMRYPKSSFDMATVLDGGILLVRIPKGTLGEDTSRLLGSLILARVWQAATARANIPAEARRDASLYLDEAQNFLTFGSLDTMLAEARKYALSMVLAHQDLAQLPKDLLAAASANARNKIYFTCAPEDARVLARHTLPELDEHDLSHLDAYTTASRLVVAGRQTTAFTMTTRPPRPVKGHAAAIRRAAAKNVPPQDTSTVDALVKRITQDEQRQRRTKGTQPGRAAEGR